MDFSERLKIAMESRCMSVIKLAAETDVCPKTIERWLDGSEPKKLTKIGLSVVLGTVLT